ncbi:hypothetical protein DXG03_007485 [Asterophora parasitica]|uniref:DUF1275 domain protein n=1 Tax=Asterophora parasitica TaxID=117018 RepID=A0A9P7G0T9_9AGAR|nr:hypothetical protein DXG03_007485 [Asterophora parasitica]
MTGYLNAITFTAISVWCSFQTGNFLQLSMSFARLFEGPNSFENWSFRTADGHALCSLLTFNIGASLGRVGDRIGATKRGWLVGGTILQALLTVAAAITIWKSGESSDITATERGLPGWTSTPLSFVALAFMSISLGIQGIQAKRLNTQFGTTLVLTTLWVELVSDPRLFKTREKVVSRDHKVIAALAVFAGGATGHTLVYKIGFAGALWIAVGLRLLIAVAWIYVVDDSPILHEVRERAHAGHERLPVGHEHERAPGSPRNTGKAPAPQLAILNDE